MAGILKIAYGHLQILLFLLKKFFFLKSGPCAKKGAYFRILVFLVLPIFLIPSLLSVTPFVFYAFPANPCLGIRGVS